MCCGDSVGSVFHWVLQSCPRVPAQPCRAWILALTVLLQGLRKKEKEFRTLLSLIFAVLITQKAHFLLSTFLNIWILEDAENWEAWKP